MEATQDGGCRSEPGECGSGAAASVWTTHRRAPITIRELRSDERESLFRFRYAIYVEEMGRKQTYADHAGRRIEEPLDDRAFHLAALQEGTIVGALRVNWGTDAAISYYRDLYKMTLAGPWFPRQTTMITKFMVAAPVRKSSLALRLCESAFEWGYRQGSRFDFIDCNPGLRPFFQRLGYRQIQPDVIHPEYGQVHPLVLSIADREHLAGVGSPFCRVLEQLPPDPAPALHFAATLTSLGLPRQGLEGDLHGTL